MKSYLTARLRRLSKIGPPASLMIPGGIALGIWLLVLHRDRASMHSQLYLAAGLAAWCLAMTGPTLLRAWLDRMPERQPRPPRAAPPVFGYILRRAFLPRQCWGGSPWGTSRDIPEHPPLNEEVAR